MAFAKDIDGKYTVVSQSSYEGPLQKQSDGFTVIRDGKTIRMDGAGCQWNSRFEWIDSEKTKIKMISVVDPAYAVGDFLLMDANGKPTRTPQTYEAILSVKRDGELLHLTGNFALGRETVTLSLRRARD